MLCQLTINMVVHAYNGRAAIIISMSVLQQGLQCPKSLAYLFNAATAHGSTVVVVILIIVGIPSILPPDLTFFVCEMEIHWFMISSLLWPI